MQPIKINIVTSLQKGELFFVQKSIELLHRDSLDTYRLRINNPRTILQEIVQTLQLINQKTIKKEYGYVLFKEALDIFTQEKELKFNTIKKELLLKELGNTDFEKVYYISNILVKENSDYAFRLHGLILKEIKKCNQSADFQVSDYDDLNRLIGYFFVELKNQGYSKDYLHKFIRNIFSPNKPAANFDDVYKIVESLINRKKEKFTVYVALKLPDDHKDKFNIISTDLVKIQYQDLKIEAEKVNQLFKDLIIKYNDYEYYKIEFECSDFRSAGYQARQKLQLCLDFVFMGYSSRKIKVLKHCFVVGENSPNRGNSQHLDYQLDGKFLSNPATYESFLNKTNDLTSLSIDLTSLAKIQSGLRYLRIGSTARELESKLLNYWIAIEYIFSSTDLDQDKVKRLRDFFPKIHSLTYATRILQYVHKSIINLNVQAHLSKFNNDDISYLADNDTLTDVLVVANDFPLLAYRIQTLNNRFKDSGSIKAELTRHQNNLERNLVRIYRLRNEIVHSAAKEKNIQEVTSHMRYYLTFVINGIIDFMLNHPIDVDKDGMISIDDYFLVADVQLQSLLIDKNLQISNLLAFKNPVEYLS